MPGGAGYQKFGGRFVLLGMLFGTCRIIFVRVRFLQSVTHEIAIDLRGTKCMPPRSLVANHTF